jgi:two-component system CheB/CheR fusion protein
VASSIANAAEEQTARPYRRGRRRAGKLGGACILLVDDDADVLCTLAARLESEGAETHTAERVEDALALMRVCGPDVIVSDLVLPNVDGFAFLRAVRSDPDLQRTPAIAITGQASFAAGMAAKDAGFDRVFVKPLQVDELIDELARRIELRRRGGGL